MILEMEKRISTGHRDCCGDMILRGDTVVGLNGFGTVIWFGRKWWILHPGRRAEPLNRYPAAELRRVAERCDRACDSDVTEACDRNPLSHILSHPLSRPKLVKIQRVNDKV